MEKNRSFDARSLVYLLFLTVLLILVVGSVYSLGHTVAGPDGGVTATRNFMKTHFVAFAAGAMLFFAFVNWLLIRGLHRRSATERPTADVEKPATPDTKRAAERGFFLYLLACLQRDGRLLDFLSEDLDRYADAQIGAAVRDIHQNCRKVVEKNLSPEAVLDRAEGETVIVEAGFDPEAVRLTGNVTGHPPFKGILRHKGWKAGRLNLPDLMKTKDSAVIAPAEVEIV